MDGQGQQVGMGHFLFGRALRKAAVRHSRAKARRPRPQAMQAASKTPKRAYKTESGALPHRQGPGWKAGAFFIWAVLGQTRCRKCTVTYAGAGATIKGGKHGAAARRRAGTGTAGGTGGGGMKELYKEIGGMLTARQKRNFIFITAIMLVRDRKSVV